MRAFLFAIALYSVGCNDVDDCPEVPIHPKAGVTYRLVNKTEVNGAAGNISQKLLDGLLHPEATNIAAVVRDGTITFSYEISGVSQKSAYPISLHW